MIKRIIACCTALGAGIVMCLGLAIGRAAGATTSASLESFSTASCPVQFEVIKETLIHALKQINVLLLAAFIVALVLVIVSKCLCGRHHCYKKGCKSNSLSCILNSVAASLALMGGMGSAIGLGNASATFVLLLPRYPKIMEEMKELYMIGTKGIMLTFWACLIIAGLIILCMVISAIHRRYHYCSYSSEDKKATTSNKKATTSNKKQ